MTTPVIIGTIATVKFVQIAMVSMLATKSKYLFKGKKEVIKSWNVTQFLEELRLRKQ